jgi:hypothetical protein
MTKAEITNKDGLKIVVEGTPQEVAMVIEQVKSQHLKKHSISNGSKVERKKESKATPTNLIMEFIDGGFFSKSKELGAIKLALEEQGHYYPVTSLSPTLIRLIRKKQIRRIRDKKRWLYVN